MKQFRACALAVIFGLALTPAMARDVQVSIGGNPVGNTAYQWAAGIADLVNRNVDGVHMTAEGTKGYVANVRLLLNGDIETGFTNSKLAYEAYHSEGDYAKVKPKQILSWMTVAPIAQHVVVLSSSKIRNLNDLAGKRVGIGQPGGTSMLDAEILFEALGMKPGKDFKDFRVKLAAMADMLKDGQLDAMVWNGSYPLPPIIKLKATHEIRFIPIPAKVSNAVIKKYPAYSEGDLPGNTYEDQPKAIQSYRLGNVLVVNTDVSEEIIYMVTKTILENLDHMGTVHPAWKRVSLENILSGLNTPLHPGALRYYREVGVPGIEEYVARTKK